MRMSCNGCRVLRKGCNDDCSIRPCLQWINSPESQAHATVFLAKFYGRAGLLNLINSGPHHLRPAIFRSLLYEACGRIVNPIYGSVGLLWSGNWALCQDAVEAVLKGAPITSIPADAAASPQHSVKGYDIRHVIRDPHDKDTYGNVGIHRVRTRTRFKRSGSKSTKPVPIKKPQEEAAAAAAAAAATTTTKASVPSPAAMAASLESWMNGSSPSRDSSLSHGAGDTTESMVSVEMGEAAPVVSRAEPVMLLDAVAEKDDDDGCREAAREAGGANELELDLRLCLGFGFEPDSRAGGCSDPERIVKSCQSDEPGFRAELGLS